MLKIHNLKIELPLKSKKRASVRVSLEEQSDGSMVVEVLHNRKKLRVESVNESELAHGLLQIVKELSSCSK
jgi:hypothetical protein